MSALPPDPALHARLTRWVAAGLLDADQARRIEAAEASDRPRRSGDGDRWGVGDPVSLVVEALGYLGAALAMVAGVWAVHRLWPDIPAGAQAAFAAVAAVVLGAAGALVRPEGDAAFLRLRSALWLLSVGCVAAFAGVLAARVGSFSPETTALVAAAAATSYALPLWRYAPAPLQHLALFAGSAVAVGAGIAALDDDNPLWASGLGVWLWSALWAVAAHRGRLPPRTTGLLAAALGLLVGAQMTMDTAAGNALALATTGLLLAAGVALRKVWLLVLGAYATVQTVPQTAERYLPGSLAAPLSVLTVGVVLLALALLLAAWQRRARRDGRGPGRESGGPRSPAAP